MKNNNPIPYIFTTEEYSKRLVFFFYFFFFLFLSFFFPPFDGSISFESSWHQEIMLLKAECVPRIGRIFIVDFYCGTGGSNLADPL